MAYRPDIPPGLQFLTGGGTLTATTISNAITLGYTGIYLDPRNTWTISSTLVIKDITNFTIESRMTGSIGWLGNISAPTSVGYIDVTTTTTDGIQVFSDGASNFMQGLTLRGLAIVGNTTASVVHYGGGVRNLLEDSCFIQNTNSTAGAYAVTNDTALGFSGSNNEGLHFLNPRWAGGYAAYGLGIADGTGHVNDCLYTNLITAGGTYSLNCQAGGGHQFKNYYDRSSPTTATVLNNGSSLIFDGGEDQNIAALCHQVTAGTTVIHNRNVTEATTTHNVTASGTGTFQLTGRSKTNNAQQWNISSGATIDLSDVHVLPDQCDHQRVGGDVESWLPAPGQLAHPDQLHRHAGYRLTVDGTADIHVGRNIHAVRSGPGHLCGVCGERRRCWTEWGHYFRRRWWRWRLGGSVRLSRPGDYSTDGDRGNGWGLIG